MKNKSLGAKPMVSRLAISLLTASGMYSLAAAQTGDLLLNQHGYTPGAQKIAVLARGEEDPIAWTLKTAEGDTVASGQSTYFGPNAASGQTVHHIDFSGFDEPGSGYVLQAGEATSFPFQISARPYAALSHDALKYFYLSRASEAVEAAYAPETTPSQTRPAGHAETDLTCFDGQDEYERNWPGCDYTLDIQGGWYDAGDYGLYTVNTGIATWTLLNIAEQDTPETCPALQTLHATNIPESGNDVPDYLDEARRGVEFILSMQIESDSPVAVTPGEQDWRKPATFEKRSVPGMAHHKVHAASWPGMDESPADDTRPRALYPPSTSATLHVAGVGAQCARVWREIDPAFAAQCLAASKKAHSAALANPDIYFSGRFDGGGGYGDGNVSDEFVWATTELWLTTREATYLDALMDIHTDDRGGSFGWGYVEPLSLLSVLSNAGSMPEEAAPFIGGARETVLDWAETYANESESTGYRIPFSETDYAWGSNSNLLNRAIVLAYAHDLTGEPRYLNAVSATMDYMLGKNPNNYSYVSGYGEQAMENPHHRFWSHSLKSSHPKPPPGVISGGPNNTAMIDPVAEKMKGKCDGQTCWADDLDSYAMNEVAINWNAPLVWVSHWLDVQNSGCSADQSVQ